MDTVTVVKVTTLTMLCPQCLEDSNAANFVIPVHARE